MLTMKVKEDPFWVKQFRIGYYVLAIVCLCHFIGQAFHEGNLASNTANRITYAKYTAKTPQQIENEFVEIGKTTNGPKFSDPVLYFKLLGQLDNLEKSSRKMELEDGKNDTFYRWAVMRCRIITGDLRTKFDISNVREAFDQESKKHLASHPIYIQEASANYWKVLLAVLELFLTCVLFTYGHNCIVLKRNGCSIRKEMFKDDPEFWYWAWLPPVGWLKYPYEVYPERQIAYAFRFLLRLASLFLSSAITVIAQVGTLVKKVEPKLDDCQTNEDCYRIDISQRTRNKYLGTFVADIFHDGFVTQTSATFSLPKLKNQVLKGLSFNLWNSIAPNTRPLGSGYASELDFSISWSGKIHGVNITTGFTYLDVYPLVVLPRGDVVNASLTVSKAVEVNRKLTLDPYLFNVVAGPVKGKVPNGGWITQAGFNLSWRPKPYLTVSANPHFIHDSGAFGEKEGYLFGSNADVAIKISKHFTLHPIEIGTGLPIAVKDQRRNRLVYGFGLDYSLSF